VERDITIAIIARNAEQTIARAIRSIRVSGNWPILLVDDCSDDSTADVACKTAGENITIVRAPSNLGTGGARQLAIDSLETPYGIWLDADDEFVPGRIERFLNTLRTNSCDMVIDEAVLIDGQTGNSIADLKVPVFLGEKVSILHTFERNWLPILNIGFRSSFARKVGYDFSLNCCEDYDFLRRALLVDGCLHIERETGYHYYEYSNSTSRSREKTSASLVKIYAKQSPELIQDYLQSNNISPEEINWILASAQVFQKQYQQACMYASALIDNNDIMPTYGHTFDFLARYIIGVCHYAEGSFDQALEIFTGLCMEEKSADILNNIAVTLGTMGKYEKAVEYAALALQCKPVYHDAKINLQLATNRGKSGYILTSHPLRRQASRDKY